MKAIAKRQITIIHTAVHALGLDDDTYRGMLFNSFKVRSSKELNYFQAERLIDDLVKKAEGLGVWKKRTSSKKFEDMQGRPGFATDKQLRMIEGIWAEVSRATDEKERRTALRHFIERITGTSALEFLQSEEASVVINALKEMQKRGKAKKAA